MLVRTAAFSTRLFPSPVARTSCLSVMICQAPDPSHKYALPFVFPTESF